MSFNGVIFDFDGTLADTLKDIVYATNSILLKEGYPVHREHRYRHFIGAGLTRLVELALPEEARGRAVELLPAVIEEYERCCLNETALYPGIESLLNRLVDSGIPTGILTNKAMPLAVRIAEELIPAKLLPCLIGARPGIPLKPDPASALSLAELLGVEPVRVAFVGDSPQDIETASNAGMTPIAVAWGFRPIEELSGAELVLHHPSELLPLLGLEGK